MADVQFDDNNTNSQSRQSRENKEKTGITGWVREKFGLSKAGARKALLAVAIVAFLVSLYFWFGLLF